MDFETRNGRLHVVPPRLSIGCENPFREMFKRPITVDGRIVRDVVDCGCGYLVIELDGTERRVP